MADNNFRSFRSRDARARGRSMPTARRRERSARRACAPDRPERPGQRVDRDRKTRPARCRPRRCTNRCGAAEPDWAADDGYAEPTSRSIRRTTTTPSRGLPILIRPPRLPAARPRLRARSRRRQPICPRRRQPYDDAARCTTIGRTTPATATMSRRGSAGRQLPALAPESHDDGYEADDQWQDARGRSIRTTPEEYEDEAPALAAAQRSRRRRGGAGSGGARHRRRIRLSHHVRRLDCCRRCRRSSRRATARTRSFPAAAMPRLTRPSQAAPQTAQRGEKLVSREEQPVDDPAAAEYGAARRFDHSGCPDPMRPGGPPAVGASSPPPAAAPAPPRPQRCRLRRPLRRRRRAAPAAAAGRVDGAEESSHRHHPARAPGRRRRQLPAAAGAGSSAAAAAPSTGTRPPPVGAARPARTRRLRSSLSRARRSTGAACGAAAAYARCAHPAKSPSAPVASRHPPQPRRRLCGPGHLAAQRGRSPGSVPVAAGQISRASSAATQPIIRRADLGAKGTFYRALVGPFASVGAGRRYVQQSQGRRRHCIVQRN